MTESAEDLAAVEQLLTESDALRGWLARLEQAAGAAPDTVRERVRVDYQRRLDQLTAGLRTHADVVANKLDEDRREHADLLARATAAREALAEVELRHAVGEFDAERFGQERIRHDGDIERHDVALLAVTERIERLEEIDALMHRAPRPLAIDLEAVAPGETTGVDAAVGEPPAAWDADEGLSADAADPLAIFDEPAPESASDGADAPVPESGPLSFRPSSASEPVRPPTTPPMRGRPFDTAPPLGIPAADVRPRFVRPGEQLAGQSGPAAIPATGRRSGEAATTEPARDDEVALAADPHETTVPIGRTLRCGECGAMNRPLEWYCEKCGAELTAV